MKTINALTITKRQADLTSGFAFIVFEYEGNEYSLQACLMRNKKDTDYNKAIQDEDSGFYEGLCYDGNKPAFGLFGVEQCYKLLKRELRKIGVRFI